MEHVLTNARIVSMQAGDIGYQPSEPLSIVIRDGKIADITTNTFAGHPQRTNCQGQLVTPGLIDCHTHLIYAGQRANEFEQRLNGISYQTIAAQGGGIMATVQATRQASQEQLTELALPRLDGLLRSGITSVEIKSGYGLTLDDEIKMLKAAKALEAHRRVKITTTLLAAHAVPPEFAGKADSYVDFICQTIIPQVAEQQLASSVDVFCESVGFNLKQAEQVFQCAIEHGLAIKGHTEQLSNLGGSALTARYNGLSVDHIEYLDEAGVQALAQSTTVATLLPGAFYFLRETRKPPIEWLRRYQVPMAIATDINPGTSPFADLTLMMNMACTLFGLTPQEALRGVTTHAAQALGVAASRGQIAVGYDADLAFWSLNHPAELSYQVGIPYLQARMVDGEPCHD